MRDAASTPRDSAQGLQSPRIVLPDFRGRIGRPFRGRAQSSHPEVPCGPEAQRRNSLHLFLRALPGKSGKMHENSHLGSFAAVSRKALVFPALGQYTGRRSGGRVVEGTPLLRVQARKGLEGSNPFHSATCPRESVLPIRPRQDFSVVFEGYAGAAEHWPLRQEARKQSLRVDILRT